MYHKEHRFVAFFSICLIFLLSGFSNLFAERPNVVLIMADDLGINDVGAYTYPSTSSPYPESGPVPIDNSAYAPIAAPNSAWDAVNGVSRTPNMDRIGADGIRMTSFYSASPVCSPTRAAVMTGSYPLRVGINKVYFPNSSEGLNPSEITLPELLKSRGYATLIAGKWHLGDHPDLVPLRHGFDRFHGLLYSNDMWLSTLGRTWPDLNYMDGDSPAASYTTGTGGVISNPVDTHEEQSYLLEAMTEEIVSFMSENAENEQPFFVYFASHAPHTPCFPHPDYDGVTGLGNYYDVVAEFDYRIGQIMDRLEVLNLENDTLVIVTSDNGPWITRYGGSELQLPENAAGSPYPYRGYKHETWEGGQRVPFLAKFPGEIPAGIISDEVGASFDLYTTIALWAGAELPDDGRVIDGGDLRPVLRGAPDAVSPHDFFVYYDSGVSSPHAIRDDGWKLRLGKLYDLSNDIQESVNVTTESDRKSSMQSKMDAFDTSLKANDRDEGTGRSVSILLRDDTVTVREGQTASVQVRLSSSSSRTVRINHFLGDDDLSVQSGQTLSFNSGNWNQWQTVTFSAALDADDVNGGAIFRATANSSNPAEIFVLESDEQIPGLVVTESGADGIVTEGADASIFTVRLSTQPIDSVTVSVIPGSDLLANGTALVSALIFSTDDWAQEQTVSVAAVDDFRQNGTRQSSVTLDSSSPDSEYDALVTERVDFTVLDDDIEGNSPVAGAWADSLVLWLKDPATNFSNGTWLDSSGLGNDVSNVLVDATYGGNSSLVSSTPGAGLFAGQNLQLVEVANNGLMGDIDLNASGNGFEDLTILAIYQSDTLAGDQLSDVRPLGLGSFTLSGSGSARFQLAADASLRYDNGNNLGSELNHGTDLLLRASRLDSGSVTDWIDNGAGLVTNIGRTSSSSNGSIPDPTSTDRFFLGELRNDVSGSDPSSGATRFAQVAVFNRALSDQEVTELLDWMKANPLAPAQTPAEIWRQNFFGTVEDTGTAADAFDADGDGDVNLLERGLGTSPTAISDRRLPVPDLVRIDNEDFLEISYHRLRGGVGGTGVNYEADGLVYTVEVSETMASGSWQSGIAEVVSVGPPELQADGLTEIIRVRTRVPAGPEEGEAVNQFMRLRITAQ